MPSTDINMVPNSSNENAYESEIESDAENTNNGNNKNLLINSLASNNFAISNLLQSSQQLEMTIKKSTATSTIANKAYVDTNSSKRRPPMNEIVFKINKGVKTFDFSFEKNVLITGGIINLFYT